MTKEELFKKMDDMLSQQEKEELMQAEDLTEYHFGLGLWIRNNWCYSKEREDDIPCFDADMESGMILEEYQRYLRKNNN